jgi:chromosome segregation and condensation protein ScpB
MNVIEGKVEGRMEVKRRRGKRRKQVLDDLQEKRWYCKMK